MKSQKILALEFCPILGIPATGFLQLVLVTMIYLPLAAFGHTLLIINHFCHNCTSGYQGNGVWAPASVQASSEVHYFNPSAFRL